MCDPKAQRTGAFYILLSHTALWCCLQVFIPALDLTFSVSKDTRIFACQNPVVQGGGRKQLPKSFVNRFTKVG